MNSHPITKKIASQIFAACAIHHAQEEYGQIAALQKAYDMGLEAGYTSGFARASLVNEVAGPIHVEPVEEPVPDLVLLEGPKFMAPHNNLAGLYMHVKRLRSVPLERYMTRIKMLAAGAGYEPEGAGTIGPPCSYGVDTVTHAVWFYDKRKA